jgi:uncharacterized protein (TIGR02270 family)
VEESFDEAEFLWATRERALDAHNQDVEHVRTWTERRLLGSLDGLSLAGDSAGEMATAALQQGPPSRASVAAYTLATLNSQTAAETLVSALSDRANVEAIRRGLELSASELFQQRLQSAAGRSPQVLALLADVRAFQGIDAQDKIPSLWASTDEVKAATVRLARNSPKNVASTVAMTALQLDHPEIRTAAMELGFFAGLREAWTVAVDMVEKRRAGFGRAAIAVAALGDARDVGRLVPAFQMKEFRRDALFAVGFSGTVVAADSCLTAMKSDILPKVAGESFCAITGLDLQKEQMVVPEPPLPDQPISFEDDDLDADLVPTADDGLPRPDVAAVERWWRENRQRFHAHERFVAGRPCSLGGLHERLANGPMRRRHGWAFEVAARTQGAYQIQTRALMTTQQAQLGRLSKDMPHIKYHQEQRS